MKRDGTFSIQVLGDKEIIIHQSETSGSYDRLPEVDTEYSLSKLNKLSASCASRLNSDSPESHRSLINTEQENEEGTPQPQTSAQKY